MLPFDDFKTLVRIGPLVSIDLIVIDPAGCILVGRRENEPARGSWFVPGGSIKKSETLDAAFARLTTHELGVTHPRHAATFRGVYEHHYETNFSDEPQAFGTHYIVLAYELRLTERLESLPDDQHGEYRWMTPAQVLTEPDVHKNTRAYCR